MKRLLQKQGTQYERGQILRFDRSPEFKDIIEGYVVGESDLFVMLHALDSNYLNLNGYTLLRRDDVHSYRIRDDHEFFLPRALKLKGISPAAIPGLDLSTFSTLFSTCRLHFPLVTIRCEHQYENECYIGKVQTVTTRSVTLQEIDPAARWTRTERYKFRDITRVNLGGGYEEALLMVAEANAQSLTAPAARR